MRMSSVCVFVSLPHCKSRKVFQSVLAADHRPLYRYVVGEISNIVMDNDQALVHMREEISRVQMFIHKHCFPRELAFDIVSNFYDCLHLNQTAQQVTEMLNSNLRVEVWSSEQIMEVATILLKSRVKGCGRTLLRVKLLNRHGNTQTMSSHTSCFGCHAGCHAYKPATGQV